MRRAGVLTVVALLVAGSPVVASPAWRLAEVSVVGTGPREPLFAWVRQVAFGAEGQLLVLDGRGAEVLVTDVASARLLRRVGRKGAGPGEFLDPALLAAASDGSFAVYDADTGSRLSRFSSDGRFVRSTDVGATRSGLVREIATTDAGAYVLVSPSSLGLRRGAGMLHPRLLFLDKAGSSGPAVVFDWKELGMEPMQPRDPTGPLHFYVDSRPIWALLPDGRHAVGQTDRYEITILDRHGAPIGRLHRDLPRRLVTAAEKKEILAEMTPALRRLGTVWGEYLPAVANVYPGPDGTVLVLRGSAAGPMLDVFSPDYALLAEVRLPEGFRLMAARDGLLAGTVRTADEEIAVKVLRMER